MVVPSCVRIWAYKRKAYTVADQCVVSETRAQEKSKALVNLHNLLDFYHFQKKTENTKPKNNAQEQGSRARKWASRLSLGHEKSE